MKKLFFVLLACMALTAASARMVKCPDFGNGPISFSVASVELLDDATRLNADIYGRPGTLVRADTDIYLKGKVTGARYNLKALEGMELGKKTILGDSAFVSPVFVFEPVAPADTVIDFVEPGGWHVSDIRLSGNTSGKKTTHISGSINGHPEASWLILIEGGADERVNKSVLIPVRNGRFSYTMSGEPDRVYELCLGAERLNGSWHVVRIFASDDEVTVDFPDDFDSDIKVTGGAASEAYKAYNERRHDYWQKNFKESAVGKRRAEMEVNGEMYTPEARGAMAMREKWNELTAPQRDSISAVMRKLYDEGRVLSDEGKKIEAQSDSLLDLVHRRFFAAELAHPSALNLYTMFDLVNTNYPHADEIMEIFEDNYADTLTDNYYHRQIAMMNEAGAPAPGRKYTDFTAPDLDGNEVRISDVIGGKVAVIDLWASWCGPCRRHSKELIPLYEKYRDRGFTVVGVAREQNSADAMIAAIERDGYPWLNLIELNDVNRIWRKYHAGNGGGKIVLVDRDGTILAVNPTTEEIAATLEKIVQ